MPYDFRDIRYIPGLDGIRFFAVSIVIISHFGFGKWIPGGFGVTIFFFLSGFLITTLLLQEWRKNGCISVGKFYMRRFLRLAPEMLVLLLGSAILAKALGLSPSLADFVAAMTYTTNYYIIYLQSVAPDGVAHSWWGHLWSLSVEEHYYLTFPILFSAIVGRPKRVFTFFILALLGCLFWRYLVVLSELFGKNWHLAYGYLASEARFDSIAYGAFFAFIAQQKRRLSPALSGAAFTIGVAILFASLVIRDATFRETLRYSVQGIGIFFVFAHLYLSESRSGLTTISDRWPFRMGGILSYGAYLWHLEILRLAETAFGILPADLPILQRVLFVCVGAACTFGLAWVSYRCVAKPALQLRSRFGSHSLGTVSAPSAGTSGDPQPLTPTFKPVS